MSGIVASGRSAGIDTLDDVLTALGHRHRRQVLYFLRDNGGVASESALVEHLASVLDHDADEVAIRLYHCVLPRLDAVGAISYDLEAGRVLYRGGSMTTELVECAGARER